MPNPSKLILGLSEFKKVGIAFYLDRKLKLEDFLQLHELIRLFHHLT